MTLDEDKEVLAAEYVLGTLDAEERAQAEALIASEPDFAALVRKWESRLGELYALGDAADPPPALWEAIAAKLPGAEPGAMRLPEIPVAPVVAAPAAAPAVASNVIELRRRLGRWRGAAGGLAAIAAALVAIMVTVALEPELLPESMRPEPEIVIRTVERTVEVPAPTAPAPPAPGRLVAVLQSDPSSPAFILTVDPAARSLTVRRVSAPEQAGKSYELWLVSDKFPAPRSLGLVGASDFTQPPPLTAYEPDTISESTFAVSLEPEGGSPTGAPTGPVLWTGKLLEAVPPGRT